VHDAIAEPEIHAPASNNDNPFELRFSIHNPGLLFAMNEMQFSCVIPHARFERGSLDNVDFKTAGLRATIGARHTIAYRCPFKGIFGDRTIYAVQAQIVVSYKTLWITRNATSEFFTWTDRAKNWIEGTVVN
jgi:hypothetical protein